ncbi:MAG: sugar ABC transporter ATP-binding protein [Candidatus Eisenbacteria bacterium]
MTAPFLELRAIGKTFPGVRALDGVSFDLARGEIHSLCGENGAGKSTLIKILCGAIPSGTYEGEIILDGDVRRFRNPREAEDQGIALIAQELALVPELSVAENLFLGREPATRGWIRRETQHEQALAALQRVGLHVDPERPIRELGVGQQQMVEIARALAKDARILVLDEPTAALSESDAQTLFEVLRGLRERGVSSIYISHRIEEILALADRVTVLRDGRSVMTALAGEVTRERIIEAMVGREVENLYPRAPQPRTSETVLSVRDLGLRDPDNPSRDVLADVSFDLHAGEVLGVAGLMGAGRTALLSTLFGTARSAVRGTIAVGGSGADVGRDAPSDARGSGGGAASADGPEADRGSWAGARTRSGTAATGPTRPPFHSPSEAIAAGLALVSEDRKRYGLVASGSVRDNLTLATMSRFTVGADVSSGARVGASKSVWLDEGARESACLSQVQSLGIRTAGLDYAVGTLSGGNQQKVVLGRWLLAEPRVLLLDEPTRGIDVGAKAEIYELIATLAGRGLGVLLVSSDLPELLGLSHRLLVLSQGRLTAELAADASPEAVMSAATSEREVRARSGSGVRTGSRASEGERE